jgi:predicted phosphodiesterase
MNGRPWTAEEQSDALRPSYSEFAAAHPGRTYGAWANQRLLLRNAPQAPVIDLEAVEDVAREAAREAVGTVLSALRAKAIAAGKDPDLFDLEETVRRLNAKGVDFSVEGGRIVTANHPTDTNRETLLDIGKDHIRLGIVSDTHGGSHYEQLTALRTFYRHADDLEVDAFIHGGDATQGSDHMHLDQPYQVHVHGADQQANYVIATHPKSERPEVKTYVIDGNHDDSFLKDGGINIVRRICDARPDMAYLGQTGAYLSLGSLNTYVVHPRGGMPYAKSYRLQKFVEQLPISRKIHLMLMGHLHSYAAVQEHGVTGFLLPCFQSQYGWMASGALHPDIGGLIVDVWLTDDGGVGRIAHEFVRFQAAENDWDRGVSYEVARGWTPNGLVA